MILLSLSLYIYIVTRKQIFLFKFFNKKINKAESYNIAC